MFKSPEIRIEDTTAALEASLATPEEVATPESSAAAPEVTERKPFPLGEHAQAARDRWDLHTKGLQRLLDTVVVPPPDSNPSA